MRFDRFADDYNALAGIQRDCAQQLAQRIGTRSGLGIDLGAGTGFMGESLGTRQLVQVDLSPAMLAYACGSRVAADARALPFTSNTFEWGVSNLALQWIADPTEWLRVIKPGGHYAACIVLDGSLPQLHQAQRQLGRTPSVSLPVRPIGWLTCRRRITSLKPEPRYLHRPRMR